MKTYLSMRKWICLAAALMLLVGCDSTDNAQAQSAVVRKKIVDRTDKGKPAQAQAPAVAAPQTAVAKSAPEPASVPVAEASPQTPAVPVEAANMPLPAEKTKSPEAVPKPVVTASLQPANLKKPASLADSSDAQMAILLNIKPPAPYSPAGKIDPFEPLLKEESPQPRKDTITPVHRERNSPLEKLDLGQLKLVAIIASGSGNRALVEETSGKGYVLKEGTYIGLNSGKVVGIALDKVLIEEEYEDAYGKPIVKKKEITLPKPPGE
jgi:type IV pilus assembly protein PilP